MATMPLPPGFRFSPTDVELIMYYLKRKVTGKKFQFEAIAEVNIYKFLPSDLPDKSCLRSRDREWYFFCPREKKYASGVQVKRATEDGYWKTTGKTRSIQYKDKTVGTVKTLVFHLGHAPGGERTDWVIHEYQIFDNQLAADGVQDTYVLCKLFKKAGLGPKNGAQYGAPFNEDEWADDDIDKSQNHAIPITSTAPFPTTPVQPENQTHPLVTGSSNASKALPLIEVPSSSVGLSATDVLDDENDGEIARLLGQFTDDDILLSHGNKNHQDNFMEKGKNKRFPSPNAYDIFNNLGDLAGWTDMKCDFLGTQGNDHSYNNVPMEDAFIELNDFLNPLNCSAGAIGPDQSSVSDIFGSYNHDNMQNVQLGSCLVVNEFASGTNKLYQLPEESSIGNNLDVHQMVYDQLHEESSAAYNLHSAHGELMYDRLMLDDMERGAPRNIQISRLMESVPAHTPSAAVCLTLSFSLPSGGSSMHIKAEVTHGAGECTDEALLFMMEGSDSGCWCNLPSAVFYKDIWFQPRIHQLSLLDFEFSHLVSWYFNGHYDHIWLHIEFYLVERQTKTVPEAFIGLNSLNLPTHLGNPGVSVEVIMDWQVSLGMCFINNMFLSSAKFEYYLSCYCSFFFHVFVKSEQPMDMCVSACLRMSLEVALKIFAILCLVCGMC